MAKGLEAQWVGLMRRGTMRGKEVNEEVNPHARGRRHIEGCKLPISNSASLR